jgi:flagellar biosynthesis protein FliR
VHLHITCCRTFTHTYGDEMDPLEQVVLKGGCILARMGGVLVFAPFLGSSTISIRIKVGLALGVTVLLYPIYNAGIPTISDPGAWAVITVGEMIIGLLIGLSASLVFEGMQLAGQIIGGQMGFSLVNIIDPQTQVDTPVMGAFQQTIGILIFLQLDVHHSILRAVARSLQYLPVGHFTLSSAVTGQFLQAAGALWIIGIRIAGPVLAATLLVDVALGFLAKASPSFPALVIGLSLKTIVGLVILSSAIAFWPNILGRQFEAAMSWSEKLLKLQ